MVRPLCEVKRRNRLASSRGFFMARKFRNQATEIAEPTYSEKLRDPRWQKKRLQIMDRDDFKCRQCHNDTKTLNVHHCYYSNKEPWEYEDSSLLTLCESCHENETESLNDFKRLFTDTLSRKGLSGDEFRELALAVSISGIYQFDKHLVDALAWAIRTEYCRDLIMEAYGQWLKLTAGERKNGSN